MKEERYDWAGYYENLLYQVKKENIDKMLQIEEARNQEEILDGMLHFISNNPLWKVLAPARKICDFVDAKRQANSDASPALKAEYEATIFGLKHPYEMWMEQYESVRMKEYAEDSGALGGGVSFAYVLYEQDGKYNQIAPGGTADDSATYYVFGGKRGTFRDGAETVLRSFLAKNRDAVVAYADEDYMVDFGGVKRRILPWFKPGWSPETLLSFFYFGNVAIIRGDFLRDVLKQCKTDNVYEVFLRATGCCEAKNILHITEVLYHNEVEPVLEDELRNASANPNWDTLQRVEKVVRDRLENGFGMLGCGAEYDDMKLQYLKDRQIEAHMETAIDPAYRHVVYDIGHPLVSAIVLSKDHPDVLATCLESLRERTDYPNLEIIVVDNGSNDVNKKAVEELKNKFKFNYLHIPMEFNFSAQCNIGVKESHGELVLLLNDDIEVVESGWLGRMVGQAMQQGIGAVGAKLLYAGTNKIQHAGITELEVGPSHKLITFPDDRSYYYGRNRVTYNMLGVTAACLLIKRDIYDLCGGLDESMKVAYNDVDFCFRVHECGYRNILRNDAILYHYESLSRGMDVMDDSKWLRLQGEKKKLYEKHVLIKGRDPYYHKDLIGNSSDYYCNYKNEGERPDCYASFEHGNARKLARSKKNVIRLSVDHAGFTPRDHALNLDDYWVSGWSYIPGMDQARYKKRLLFKNEKNEIWEGLYFIQYRKDVEELLFAEKNVSGAGFAFRFVKGSLEKGTYLVGMLYEDLENGKTYVTWSDKSLEII